MEAQIRSAIRPAHHCVDLVECDVETMSGKGGHTLPHFTRNEGNRMNVQQWQIEIERAMAWTLAGSALATIIGFWILYEILKAAIKNGIDESKMGRVTATKLPPAPAGYKWELVKDEAPMVEIRATR